MPRTLLLVDDEENTLRSLVRLLRHDGYHILTAASGAEGLEELAKHRAGVILSDQRMPGMSGTDFLARVRETHPETVRLVLSGYIDLPSVTEAINRGAVYKFLTKPWEDDLLRANIAEAFHYYELHGENRRLTQELREANGELARINRSLEQKIEEKTRELTLNLRVLQVAQEVLENLPIAVVGVGDEGIIATANRLAHETLAIPGVGMIGRSVDEIFPGELAKQYRRAAPAENAEPHRMQLPGGPWATVHVARLGDTSHALGTIVVVTPDSASRYAHG